MVENSNPPKFKFIDFGFACKDDECFESDMAAATPFLSPPEYYNRDISPGRAEAADIWALGSTLLEVLLNNDQIFQTDSLPVSLSDVSLEGYNLAEKNFDWRLSDDAAVQKFPKTLVKLLDRMLRINPKDRKLST